MAEAVREDRQHCPILPAGLTELSRKQLEESKGMGIPANCGPGLFRSVCGTEDKAHELLPAPEVGARQQAVRLRVQGH